MTLHWWMHWFWITCQLWVYSCALTPSPMHSLSTKVQDVKIYNETSDTRLFRNVTGTIYVTTPIPIKLRKSMKKHDTTLVTTTPKVKTQTVISRNGSNFSIDNAENETSANLSSIIRMENVSSSLEGNNATSQNLVINLETLDDKKEYLTAASITGITLGCVSIMGIVCAVSFILYRNYGFNRPQVLNDHCSNPDSSGYIDDSSVRENSEEMYSLDNDSFLNSLEAMTIQNLWTDSVKHTKL